jgi:spermidine/putrescine transport system permease protein
MAGIAAGGARQNPIAPYLLVAPGVLWLLCFYIVPLIALGETSVAVQRGPWYDGFQRAFTTYGTHFFRSLRYALAATLFAIALGYPLAYFMAFRSGRFKNLLLGLVILPFFTTFLVRTFAWKTILNDSGPAVSLLTTLHILPQGGRLLDTWVAVIGGLTYNFLPFMISKRSTAASPRRPRISIRARSGVFSRWYCRSPSRACSPEACSRLSRPRATSSTPNCSVARTSG